MSTRDTVYFDARVESVLDASIIVLTDDGEEVLLPMSQLRDETSSDHDEEGAEIVVAIPRWLADDREVDYRETFDG